MRILFILILSVLTAANALFAQSRTNHNPAVNFPAVVLNDNLETGYISFLYTEEYSDFTPTTVDNTVMLILSFQHIIPDMNKEIYGGMADAFQWMYDHQLNVLVGTLTMPVKGGQSGNINIPILQTNEISCNEGEKMGFVVNITPAPCMNGVNRMDDDKVSTYTCTTQSLTSTQEDVLQDLDLSLAPNPARDEVMISFSSLVQNSQVAIYDNLGAFVESYKVKNSDRLRIDVSDYVEGVYSVKLDTGKKQLLEKLIIVK